MIVSDASHNRPQAYVHRHKLRKRLQGFTKQGPCDVCMISEELLQLLCKIDSSNDDGIFSKIPHMTWDNYFSGDKIMERKVLDVQ